MQQPRIIIFNGDLGQGDEEYLAWVADNQDGFIANIAREPSSDLIRLHRASCSEAQKHRPGESLTRHSQWKICSPAQDLLADYLAHIYGGSSLAL